MFSSKVIASYIAIWIVGSITLTHVGAAVGFIGGIAGVVSWLNVRRLQMNVTKQLQIQQRNIALTRSDAEDIESRLRASNGHGG